MPPKKRKLVIFLLYGDAANGTISCYLKVNAHSYPPRNMKATIFHNNEHTNIIISKLDITPEECKENLKHIHTTITSQYLSSRKNNKVTNARPYDIHSSEKTLPCYIFTKLAQLRANKSPLL